MDDIRITNAMAVNMRNKMRGCLDVMTDLACNQPRGTGTVPIDMVDVIGDVSYVLGILEGMTAGGAR